MVYQLGQQSGQVPNHRTASPLLPIPGGASNALIAGSTMYVVGQQLQPDGLFTGFLTIVNLNANTAGSPISISDGAPGAPSRLMLADDNTLWIGMTKCTNGERYAKGLPYGCLTMFNTVEQFRDPDRALPGRPDRHRECGRACTRSTWPKAARCTSSAPPMESN